MQCLYLMTDKTGMAHLYLGLGTNLGDKEQNLRCAVNMIEERIGKSVSLSSFVVTAPWGFVSDNDFLNAVVCVDTCMKPEEVLSVTQSIEKEMGRTIKSVDGIYHDRIIDIDILLYDNCIIDTDKLKIPHPLMHTRDFVMKPMAEIAPLLVHPILGKTMYDLYSAL